MSKQDYMPVEMAREHLGISPREMAMLLEAGALRCRKDLRNETVREVCAEDVQDAVKYLTYHRQEEQERRRRLFISPEESDEAEEHEFSFFTFSDSELATLLLAAVSYFDAERDIYFMHSDERGSIHNTLRVIEKIYSRLEKDRKGGRSMSETVAEIYKQQPDQPSRNAIFLYLMRKVQST